MKSAVRKTPIEIAIDSEIIMSSSQGGSGSTIMRMMPMMAIGTTTSHLRGVEALTAFVLTPGVNARHVPGRGTEAAPRFTVDFSTVPAPAS